MKPLVRALVILSLATTAPARGEIVERIVAKVNGQIVTLSEFESRQMAAIQGAKISMDQVAGYLQKNNARILQEAIDDALIVGRASEIGAKVQSGYVRDIIDNIKKENKLESDEALLDQLRREGMSLDDLKRNIEKSVLRRQVLSRELEARANVTEAERLKDYEARKAEYTHPETVTLLEIYVRSEELAAALVARARSGEDFSALAKEASEAASARTGGALGTLSRGELSAELEAVAFALPKGGVSDPVASAGGYRIFKLADKTLAGVVPFEQVQEEIGKRLAQAKWEKQYAAYVEGLRKTAVIEVLVKEVPLSVSSSGTTTTIVEPPAADEGSEFATTPQDKPEHVGPATAVPSPPPQ